MRFLLRLLRNVTAGLKVNEKITEKAVRDYLPFIATENLMMEAVSRGKDRQQVHEIIRRCSRRAMEAAKNGETCSLLSLLAAEDDFGLSAEEMEKIMEPSAYVGRCPEQVSRFLEKIRPLLEGASAGAVSIDL